MILSLICQLLADNAALPPSLTWLARIGMPLAAILIPLGFFLSVPLPTATQSNAAVAFVYLGAVVLAASVLTLEIGLVRAAVST